MNFKKNKKSKDFVKMPIKCLAELTDEEIDEVRGNVKNSNTKNTDKNREKFSKTFLTENEMDDDCYAFDMPTLNEWLSKLGSKQELTKNMNATGQIVSKVCDTLSTEALRMLEKILISAHLPNSYTWSCITRIFKCATFNSR